MQSNPQDAIAAMQAQALDAIRAGQSATLEAIKNWNDSLAKVAPVPGPQVPGIPAEFKDAMGDPATIVDSVYDFAQQLLDLNKQFVHQLLQASSPTK